MDGPVGDVPESEESGAGDAALFVEFVAVALDGSFTGR